jgi:hypothetical protein
MNAKKTIPADTWTAVRREVALVLLDLRKAQTELLKLTLMRGHVEEAQLLSRVREVAEHIEAGASTLDLLVESTCPEQFAEEQELFGPNGSRTIGADEVSDG